MNRTRQIVSPDALQLMLRESVDRFLTEYRNGAADFSNFTSIFSRFLQILPDPPLEIVWFYSALTFHSAKLTSRDGSGGASKHCQVSAAAPKDLFQVLVSCSASCNAAKKIAVLAPVIYELYGLVSNSEESREELEGVLEGAVGYISICCGNNFGENGEFEALSSCFGDLVRVWLVGIMGGCCKLGEYLRVFCPIVSEGVREHMFSGRCGVAHLAGIVMSEAFLLRLSLRFGSGNSRGELKNELHCLAVQMMTSFLSYYFLDALLRMLLEPFLPLISLLKSENEAFLREILYEVVIMVDCSFFNPEREIQLPDGRLKNLAVTWLLIANNAIQSVRETGDEMKVTCYLQAFSESCLPPLLIKWALNQPDMQTQISTPNVFSPVTLIKWLLHVEDQGVRVFDSDISKFHAKAVICKSRTTDYDFLPNFLEGSNLPEDNSFYMVNKDKGDDKVNGNVEMVDSLDIILLAADGLVKPVAFNDTRKRKEGRRDGEDKQVKFVKCHLSGNTTRKMVLPIIDDDGLSSGSEAEDPSFDEDMEFVEQ